MNLAPDSGALFFELRARTLWRARSSSIRHMVRVSRVHPDSIAAELGIEPGTELQSVNGRELADFLDWEFLTADDELVIEAKSPSGEAIVYEIERPEGE